MMVKIATFFLSLTFNNMMKLEVLMTKSRQKESFDQLLPVVNLYFGKRSLAK